MSILLQIPRHRRNHSQHVLKDVIPPLEQLVSDPFTPRLYSLATATKWITLILSNLKQHTLLPHVFVSQDPSRVPQLSISQKFTIRVWARIGVASEGLTHVQFLQGCWSETLSVTCHLCFFSRTACFFKAHS